MLGWPETDESPVRWLHRHPAARHQVSAELCSRERPFPGRLSPGHYSVDGQCETRLSDGRPEGTHDKRLDNRRDRAQLGCPLRTARSDAGGILPWARPEEATALQAHDVRARRE